MSALPGSILFLCGQNAIRSPMAEALARAHLPRSVLVRSAGLRSGQRDPFVDAVLAEVDVPLEEHEPRALDDLEDDLFDVVVTLTPEAAERADVMARTIPIEVVRWTIEDPSLVEGRRDQRIEAYRAVRDRLDALIRERFGL